MLMILERGAGKAVITLGGKGSVIGTQESRMPKHIPVTPAEPVDTTVTYYSYICSMVNNNNYIAQKKRLHDMVAKLCFVFANNPCRSGLGCLKVDNALHWINHYLSDSMVCFSFLCT